MNVAKARRAVSLVFFMMGSLIGVWASRIPDIKTILGYNEAEFGILLLIMASGAFVSFPVAGQLVDRLGAAPASKILSVFLLAMFIVLPLGMQPYVISALLFLTGFGIGALDVSMNAWGAEVEQRHGRPIMSSFHGLFSLGAGVGAGLGALALRFDLTVFEHFAGWGALQMLLLLVFANVPWTSDKAEPGEKAPFLAIPKGALFLVGIMALVAALGEGAMTDWAALYQIQELGYDPSTAAIAFAVFSVAMVVMRFAGDRVIARHGAVQVARVSGIGAVLGTALVVWGASPAVIWVGAAIMGLGNAVIFPLAMSRAAADPVMSKGTALAAIATLGYGAFLLGPPVLGFIGEAVSLRAAFALVAVLAIFIVVLSGALKPERG